MRNKKGITKQIRHCLILVVVFLLICPGNLSAKKQKRGAYLVIEKKDGQVKSGELLRVNQDSLLLMTFSSGTGVTIEINEINNIRKKKKPRLFKGVVKGFTVGAILGTVIEIAFGGGDNGSHYNSFTSNNIRHEELNFGKYTAGGLFGGIIGGAIGFIFDYNRITRVKKQSPTKIKRIIKKLKKKARFKN